MDQNIEQSCCWVMKIMSLGIAASVLNWSSSIERKIEKGSVLIGQTGSQLFNEANDNHYSRWYGTFNDIFYSLTIVFQN